jgi:hypothetical protein
MVQLHRRSRGRQGGLSSALDKRLLHRVTHLHWQCGAAADSSFGEFLGDGINQEKGEAPLGGGRFHCVQPSPSESDSQSLAALELPGLD